MRKNEPGQIGVEQEDRTGQDENHRPAVPPGFFGAGAVLCDGEVNVSSSSGVISA